MEEPDAVVAESAVDSAEIPAADWLQEERDVDQEEEVGLPEALKAEEAASAPPAMTHQEMELIVALQFQLLE